jgi:hypothetical protein
MKSKLKRPFVPPRKVVDRLKGGFGPYQSDTAIEQATPDGVQSDSEEATALGLGWKRLVVKETQYPEVEPVGRNQGYVRLDSITETGDEYMARMDREQRADTTNGCKLTLNMVEALGDEHAYLVRGALPDNGEGVKMVAASPNLSEFEHFLDGCDRDFVRNMAKKKGAMAKARVERQALAIPDDDSTSRVVRLKDFHLDSRSDDDDVPIASTITLAKPKRKVRTKVPVKWSYETVSEPTGAASKYWDAGAPAERATKRLAKEKLIALKAGNEETEDQGSYEQLPAANMDPDSYEQLRADNMERNNVMLTSLGFVAMPIEPPHARSSAGSVTNSDDEEYMLRADEKDVPKPPRTNKKAASKQKGRAITWTLRLSSTPIIYNLSCQIHI